MGHCECMRHVNKNRTWYYKIYCRVGRTSEGAAKVAGLSEAAREVHGEWSCPSPSPRSAQSLTSHPRLTPCSHACPAPYAPSSQHGRGTSHRPRSRVPPAPAPPPGRAPSHAHGRASSEPGVPPTWPSPHAS